MSAEALRESAGAEHDEERQRQQTACAPSAVTAPRGSDAEVVAHAPFSSVAVPNA
jgi:hypothetical protein